MGDESAVPVESDACGSDMLAMGCAEAGPCFNEALGVCLEDGTFSVADCDQAALCAPCFENGFICQEDGTFGVADCEQAAPCAPCFPKSKCGSTPGVEDEEDAPFLPEVDGEDDPDANLELPEEEVPEEETEMESVSAVSGITTRGILVAGWLTLLSGLLLSGFNVA